MHLDQRYLTQYLIKHGMVTPEQALKHCEAIPGGRPEIRSLALALFTPFQPLFEISPT